MFHASLLVSHAIDLTVVQSGSWCCLKTRDQGLEEVREQKKRQEAAFSRYYLLNFWRAAG